MIQRSPNDGKKILVVDSSSELLSRLSALLVEQGYIVATARDRDKAHKAVKREHPNLILLDIELPDIDGFEVCREIKTRQSDEDIPVVFMRSNRNEGDISRGYEAGGVDFIDKPIIPVELLARLETHLTLSDCQLPPEKAGQNRLETFTESETLFRQVANAAFEGIVISKNRKLIDFNDNFLLTFGYRREDVLGLDLMSFVAPDSRDYVSEQIHSGNDGPYEHLAVKNNGEIFPVEVYSAEISKVGERVRVTAVRDISEREGWEKAVLKERDRSERISNTIPTSVLVINKNFEITFTNGAAKSMLRLTDPIPIHVNDFVTWKVYDMDGEFIPPKQRIFQRIFRTKKPILDGYRFLEWPDGLRILVSIAGAPLIEDGDVSEVIVSMQDVTGLWSVESALRESEKRYRNLFESVPLGLYHSTPDGKTINVNQQLVEILGYDSREKLMGVNVRDIYTDPSERDKFVAEITQKGVVNAFSAEALRADGTSIHLENHARLVRSDNGAMTIQGAIMDVTERMRARALLNALNQSALAMEKFLTHEDIFRAISENFSQLGFSCMLFPYDADEQRLYTRYLSYDASALEAVEKLMGKNHKENSLRPKGSAVFTEVVHEQSTVFLEDIQDLARQWLPRRAKRHAKRITELLKVHKVIIAPLVIDEKVIGVFFVQGNDLREEDSQAITSFAILVAASWRKAELFEQAQQEIAARKEADHQRLLQTKALEAAANGVVITDRQGDILWANPAVSKLTGYDLSEIIGKNTRLFNSKQHDKAVYRDLWETILAGGVWQGEMINRRKDGSLYSEDMTITPVNDAKDQINQFIAIKRDITERKRADRALVESEQKFATAFRSSPYPIILSRLKDARIIEVNLPFEKATGYKHHEVVGFTTADLGFWIEPQDERRFLKEYMASRKSGQKFEFPFRMRNGDRLLFNLSIERIKIAGEDCALAVAEDITVRRQAEEQIRLQAAALDAAANGIMITTTQGEIIWANSAMQDLTGYSRQEILGQSPELFQSGVHNPDFFESIGTTLDQKLVWQGEIINRRKDGGSYYEMQTIAPVLGNAGEITHHITIKHDISDRKKIEREIQQRVIQLGAIISMGQVVTSSLDIDQILADVIAQVPLLVGAESQAVLLLEADELVFVATSGENAENLKSVRMPATQGLAGQVLESGKSIFISNADQQNKIYRRVDEVSGFDTKSIMAVPLSVDNQIIGVIEAVHSSLDAFDEDDLYLFEIVAAWASIAIGNAHHYEATQRRLLESEAFVNISRALSQGNRI
jgi:PAS domain S-box-containing protein